MARPVGSKNKVQKEKVNTGIYIEKKCLSDLDELCAEFDEARPEIICKLLELRTKHPASFKALFKSKAQSKSES